jgi:hypothetical protein
MSAYTLEAVQKRSLRHVSDRKQIDFAVAVHLPSDEFEAGDLPFLCPLDHGKVIAGGGSCAGSASGIRR